jgi:acyl carrier protein
MASDATIDQVRDIMQDVFDRDDLQIDRTTTADDIEEWDSLSHVRLMVAIERRLKIRFKSSEIEKLKNVGELVDLINAKR